jgi:hypothetical protein
VSGAAIPRWRNRFVESGKAGLDNAMPGAAGSAGSQTERRLRAEAEQLKLALAEATVQLCGSGTRAPEWTYRRRLARLRDGGLVKGPWPAPRVDAVEAVAAKYATEWPAWGHRTIAAPASVQLRRHRR